MLRWLLLCVWVAPAWANNDVQLWPAATIVVSNDHVALTGDGVLQVTDDVSHPSAFLLRGMVAYRPSESWSIGGGYTVVISDIGVEQRIVEEVMYRASRSNLTLTSRSRMEQRLCTCGTGVATRLRQLVRVDVPRARLVGWTEAFLALDGTEWSGRSGLSAILTFIGPRISLSNAIALEPGYLNFTSFDPFVTRHIAAVFAVAKF
ncbi:MAG: DUF2490 domain-containing protein [Kofleriaceae bacterium]